VTVVIKSTGSFDQTEKFLKRLAGNSIYKNLETLARRGVSALASVTPTETGATATSWDYQIQNSSREVKITWTNSHKDATGTPIVIMLQYGHGTGTGGYVQGRNFIIPAIAPVFEAIQNEVWGEVKSS
jgi:hypothetical protein